MAIGVNNLSLEKAFNYTEAMGGKLVGFEKDGVRVVGTYTKMGNNYIVSHNGINYTFDTSGKCLDRGMEGVTLRQVEATIQSTSGTAATRGSGEEVTLAALEPRDQFAISILNSLIPLLNKPESMDDANILQWCTMAYKWAQGMLVASANARKLSGGGTAGGSVSVDTSELQTASDKLLNNLVAAVASLKQQLAINNSNETTRQAAGIKLQEVVKIDNPDGDKLEVSGGGGSLSFDSLLPIIGTEVTSIPVFKNKAAGYALMNDFAAAIIKTDSTLAWLRQYKSFDEFIAATKEGIFRAIKTNIDGLISSAISSHVNQYHNT